ncbi:AsmA-like C-terminal region-containing protein [Mesorhizobium sp. VNQ89]|uniref:AsmA family protein n=1 Tax=Mesorhizobium quangtriensis TaxID=3157709 RepID=UPI0032B8712D
MAASTLRRTVWGIAAVVGLAVLAGLALPLIASTRLSSDRIAEEMSTWSGLDVSIAGAPKVGVWPNLHVNLTDIRLLLPDGTLVASAERAQVDLSALAALGGDIDFTAVRFNNPALRLDHYGKLPALPRNGRIALALATARSLVEEASGTPDTSRLPADNFGTIEFVNGRIIRPFDAMDIAIATDINGRISWPALNGRIGAFAKGVLKGESLAIEFSSASPLLLLGGAATPATLSLKSGLTDAAFDGTASLGNNPYVAGQARFSTPSVGALLAWSGAGLPVRPAIEVMTVESRIIGDPARVRFEDARIMLDGSTARGVLDLLLSGGTPKVSGTMAFDTLELGAFLSTFTPFDPMTGEGPGNIDADFASLLNLDLRLSAPRATLGTIALTDMAATARVDGRLAAFDISDASALGGDIQAGLRFDHKDEGAQVELRLLATDVSGDALGAATGMENFLPKAGGTLSLILKGVGDSWDELMARANGSFSASFGPGTLPGMDIDALLADAKGDAPFTLTAVAGTGSKIDAMEIKAVATDGVARIDKVEIRSPLHRVTMSGTVSLDGSSVALTGSIAPPQQANASQADAAPAATFLINGSSSDALVTPTKGLSSD